MNFKSSLYGFLLLFLLPLDGFPIYDTLAVNLTPTEQDLKFCFSPDYASNDNIYLAALVNNQFYFVSHTNNEDFNVTSWTGDTEPPIFAQKSTSGAIPTFCLYPLQKTALQGISVYAGVGGNLAEVLSDPKRYAKIFDGNFITLPQPAREWTVMVYVVGSNLESKPLTYQNGKKLGHWASQDILEMLAGTTPPTNDNLNVVIATGGSTRYGWQTVKYSFIHQGTSNVLTDIGAKSMADPQTLSDFVSWAHTNFPAPHEALILWDHGNGADGYGLDTSEAGNNNLMHLPQLHQAYQTIRQTLGKPLDIVVYDACLMAAIEVAEVTATVASSMAASVELEPEHGIYYTHLLKNLADTSPSNGVDFGKLVKTGYLEQSKALGSFQDKQITYSVFDLTQLATFTETFTQFATEFNKVLKEGDFLGYEMLSHGIIRAPGYPFKDTGRFLRSLDQRKQIRIDLYNILQTVLPDYPQLKIYADDLLTKLQQLVVDYETNDNIKAIQQDAGRLSLNIGSDDSYLTILPQAYTMLNQALDYYKQRRKEDPSNPEQNGSACYNGITCGDAHWLKLPKAEIQNLEGYYGQQQGEIADIYLVKTLLQYPQVPENPNLGVDGQEACQYQLCVNDTHCENLTVKKQALTLQRYQLLAEVQVNQSPAVLTFCGNEATWGSDSSWPVCGLAQQTNEVWGRDDTLYPQDTIVPNTLHYQKQVLQPQAGNALVVEDNIPVTLKRTCDATKAAIVVAYSGLNGQRQFDTLCNNKGLANCFCQADDFKPAPEGDVGCRQLNMKSGIYLED